MPWTNHKPVTKSLLTTSAIGAIAIWAALLPIVVYLKTGGSAKEAASSALVLIPATALIILVVNAVVSTRLTAKKFTAFRRWHLVPICIGTVGLTIAMAWVMEVIVLMPLQQSPRKVNLVSQANASVRSFIEDFEKGSLDHYQEWEKEFAREDSAVFVSHMVRKGQYALKIMLRPGDIGNKVSGNRAELVIKNGDPYGSEAWYGWSFLIPQNYQDSDIRDPWQILGQWHHEPNFAKGENWKSHGIRPPTISLHYGLLEDDSPAVGIDKYGYGEKKRIVAFRKIDKGKWYDFVIHIRWSLEEDGFVEAWLNSEPFEILKGEKRKENKILGPTMFNELPHFFKVGLYRNPQIGSVNVIYIDEIRIDKKIWKPL